MLMPSWARRSLPWNATEIHEYYSDSRFGSDFVRLLKAKIDREDFEAYAERLKMSEVYDPEQHTHLLGSWYGCDEPWWDPPTSLDGVRFEPANGRNYYAMATWHEGYVYVKVFSW